jgi:hypothetical protein
MKIVWKWNTNPTLKEMEAAQDAIIEYIAEGPKWPARQTGFETITNLVNAKEFSWTELYMRFPGASEMGTTRFCFPGWLKGENVGEGFNWIDIPEGMEGHGQVVEECLRIAKGVIPHLKLADEIQVAA